MSYDNAISRGNAAAGMPADTYGKGKKKLKPKEGETTSLRDAAKKKGPRGGK